MTKTEQFYLKCIKYAIEGKFIEEIPNEIDYKVLYQLASKQAVTVLLYYALKNVLDKTIAQFSTALQKSFEGHASLDIRSEFDKQVLIDTFEKNKIKFVPLKGFLLKPLYKSPEMRYASDCDILVEKSTIDKVKPILLQIGYDFVEYTERHYVFRNSVTNTWLEVHTEIVGKEFAEKLNLHFSDAVKKDGYEYYYVFKEEDFYLSFMAHCASHFYSGAGVGIRSLCDIKVFRDSYKSLDEKYIDTKFQSSGILKFKNAFERATDVVFNDKESDEFTDKLLECILQSGMLSNKEKTQASIVANNDSDISKSKSKALFRKFFPKKNVIYNRIRFVKKCKFLLPIGYILNIFLAIKNYKSSINGIKQLNNVDQNAVDEIKYFKQQLGIEDIYK